MPFLRLCRTSRSLFHGDRRFDPWLRRWEPAAEGVPDAALETVSPREAVRWLYGEGGGRALPVAVIGPKAASAEQIAVAESLGAALAGLGVPLLTGGKGGVMEAASRGAFEKGGMTIGLIPDEDWREANPFVRLPLATGLGPVRNALIARAAEALVAVGGEFGTLSEMAFGKHFDKPVYALCQAPPVAGVGVCADVEDCLDRLCESLLHL